MVSSSECETRFRGMRFPYASITVTSEWSPVLMTGTILAWMPSSIVLRTHSNAIVLITREVVLPGGSMSSVIGCSLSRVLDGLGSLERGEGSGVALCPVPGRQ